MIANSMQIAAEDPEQVHAGTREVFFPVSLYALSQEHLLTLVCHIYGVGIVLCLCPYIGNLVIALHAFEIERLCQLIEKYKATWQHIVPPVALALATSPVVSKYDLSSLEVLSCAAAPLKKDLQERLMARLPRSRILQMYGMTEASPVTHLQRIADHGFTGTVGTLVPNMEARIVDDNTGKDLGINETGELLVRGPNVMMGYVGDLNNIGVLSSDGWYSSGDIAYIDKNGLCYVVDRKKELIKYKGFQVPPAELEGLLLTHPKVLDAAVCAYYCPEEATEVPLAYVVLAEEDRNQQTCKEIQRWADKRVAGYKQLRGGVHLIDAVPRNPSGKILRRMLPIQIQGGKNASKM
ncbi:putative 4-coumarate--CoA ligase 1 [Neolecta irregularis DAH-3]|uniref:Putative 4-coumarate--CoA ligase 1 n=1 Tax=Neolecta irregularis (strain DAH-3) TaxID=1198029 RepID=A0A1U7LQJ7_NEOID|nr:putative 4-coumarate--CoA ligase 1 [Neolecta irregularis DAH-3]|eukprot:OLL24927.1 putative 4-coumarate--CoA ligase 1 [Neolecta irregularis DAH-3]